MSEQLCGICKARADVKSTFEVAKPGTGEGTGVYTIVLRCELHEEWPPTPDEGRYARRLECLPGGKK